MIDLHLIPAVSSLLSCGFSISMVAAYDCVVDNRSASGDKYLPTKFGPTAYCLKLYYTHLTERHFGKNQVQR